MRILRDTEVPPSILEVTRGSTTVRRLNLGSIEVGIVSITANTEGPKKVHAHPEGQVFYVVQGSGFVSDGKKRTPISKGSIIITEPNEEHYFITENSELTMVEVKFR